MNIKYLTRSEFEKWDAFVANHKKGTIFHQSIWLKYHLGDLKVLTIWEEESIVGGFAFVISKKAGIKGIFRPPYTPYYHPLVGQFSEDGNSDKETEILLLILDQIKEYNVSLIIDSKTKYLYPYQNSGFKVKPKLNYSIDPFDFINKVSKRKRSIINKYLKSNDSLGVRIEEGRNTEEILQLWEEFGKEKTMNTYSSMLKSVFSEDSKLDQWGSISLYSADKRLLAAGIYMYDKNKLYNLIPIVNYKVLGKKERNIGDYLYYKLIEIAKQKKLLFDFEGSEIPGVEMMYRRLGGEVDLKYIATNYDLRLKIVYDLLGVYNKLKSN